MDSYTNNLDFLEYKGYVVTHRVNLLFGMMSTCRQYINFFVAKMDSETCRNLVIVPIILKS